VTHYFGAGWPEKFLTMSLWGSAADVSSSSTSTSTCVLRASCPASVLGGTSRRNTAPIIEIQFFIVRENTEGNIPALAARRFPGTERNSFCKGRFTRIGVDTVQYLWCDC
jgi:hypothetical protein